MFRSLDVATVLSAFAAGPALADCTVTSPYVQAYLSTFPGWHIVTEADLVADDQALWRQYHAGACPGLAQADLKGDGRPSYGLVMRNGAKVRMAILVSNNMGLGERVLSERESASTPVVFAGEPGPAEEFETHERVDLPHASLIFATLASTATQYYWQDDTLKNVLISD